MTQIEIAQRNKKIKELAQEGKTVDEIAGVFNRASALYISTDFFKAFFAFITKHLFS